MTEPSIICRACGLEYEAAAQRCPRCKVPVKGDIRWRAIGFYLFFVFFSTVVGMIAFHVARIK